MNYYNEFDPHAAAWLNQLITEGLIPDGHVDTRSIKEVSPSDLTGYTQCHFFAGIGGWPLALDIAGWPRDRPVWTGSCPCQPYSAAGKQKGNADERNLWPEFFRLICECRPDTVFGEQVSSAIRHGWLDGVCGDLEGEGYTCGAVVLGAHSVGSPHIRQRLYWLADANGWRRHGRKDTAIASGAIDALQPQTGSKSDRLANASGTTGERNTRGLPAKKTGKRSTRKLNGNLHQRSTDGSTVGGLGHTDDTGSQRRDRSELPERTGQQTFGPGSAWADSYWHQCTDGKARRVPVERPILSVADGVSTGMVGRGGTSLFPLAESSQGRVMLLRGYGNAIVPQVAAEFITAFMDSEKEPWL